VVEVLLDALRNLFDQMLARVAFGATTFKVATRYYRRNYYQMLISAT